MKKGLLSLILAALMVVAAFAVVGCSATEEAVDDVQATADWTLADAVRGDGKTLVVATDPTYPPFESRDGGEVVGFDIDLVKAIAEKMGAEVEFVFFEWDALLTALSSDSRDFDFAASAMTITEERAQSILFSNPYFVSFQALGVPADSNITSISDLGEGSRVGVQTGTTGHIFATDYLEDKGVTIMPYAGGQDTFLAMSSGEVDAVILDIPVVLNQAAEGDFAIKTIPIPSAEQENFGFSMGKSRTGLAEAINDALAAVIADGTYAEIYARWIDADNPPTMP
ncbi:MAG: basic amino acid ABC transporter substrate-binding protein [Coriobacteriia bacterium]|nr:basic amino acid ABC transporter substrate-binding protein [Coriobacteriia bacterium]MCL2537039.1 basic amino acid ABC transporter substrate-binding protein [Coriobacteriia bacterium]